MPASSPGIPAPEDSHEQDLLERTRPPSVMICLALLLFCLIERQVRQALGSEQKMTVLYPGNQMVRSAPPDR